VASGSADLFASAADDRLHEPYRAPQAPVLATVRERLPDGAIAATLSGSGPTVIVWARREAAAACSAELAERFPDADVLQLSISPTGAAEL
jgi:homoserine kinase